jgi:hypothetical protein
MHTRGSRRTRLLHGARTRSRSKHHDTRPAAKRAAVIRPQSGEDVTYERMRYLHGLLIPNRSGGGGGVLLLPAQGYLAMTHNAFDRGGSSSLVRLSGPVRQRMATETTSVSVCLLGHCHTQQPTSKGASQRTGSSV